MKIITINTRSWHFLLLDKLNFESRWSTDLCTYTRGVIGALLLCLVVAFVVAIFTWSFADFLAWAAFCLINWTWIMIDFGAGAAVITVFALSFIGVVAARTAYGNLPPEKQQAIGDVWDSIIGKLCVRIQRDDRTNGIG